MKKLNDMQNVKENGYRMQYRTLKNEGCEPEKHLKVNKIELKCFGIEFCYVVSKIEEGRKKKKSDRHKKRIFSFLRIINFADVTV